jgi:hypothetical protein
MGTLVRMKEVQKKFAGALAEQLISGAEIS